jgi:hypothetical protein
LCDVAARLGVLSDHVGELDTQLQQGEPETLDLRNDLNTTVCVVAGLDLSTVDDPSPVAPTRQ